MWIQINIQCNIQRQFWVVCVGYRRVFCKELNIQEEKNTEKNNSKIQNLNCRVWKIKQVGFAFILQIGSCFSKWTWGWLSGSFLNLFFLLLLLLLFCIFEMLGLYCFCILYFWFVWFVCFLYFVFFEKLHSYCFLVKKIQHQIKKKTKTIQHKYTLYFFVFVHYFQKGFVFFFVCFHSFTDCTVSFCMFRSLDMPSKNKTANPLMYVVFPFCWWFCPPQCCICL